TSRGVAWIERHVCSSAKVRGTPRHKVLHCRPAGQRAILRQSRGQEPVESVPRARRVFSYALDAGEIPKIRATFGRAPGLPATSARPTGIDPLPLRAIRLSFPHLFLPTPRT